MFEQILELVKEKIGDHQIPSEHQNQVNEEIAGRIKNDLATQAAEKGGVGDLLSSLSGSLSGSPLTGAIAGGVVSFIRKQIWSFSCNHGGYSRSYPFILEKFAHKANDPNDNSVTADSIASSLGNGGGLGNLGGLLKGL